jgi:hypothetical protein
MELGRSRRRVVYQRMGGAKLHIKMYNRNKCICLGVFSVMATGDLSLFLFSTSMYAQNDTARTAENTDPSLSFK